MAVPCNGGAQTGGNAAAVMSSLDRWSSPQVGLGH